MYQPRSVLGFRPLESPALLLRSLHKRDVSDVEDPADTQSDNQDVSSIPSSLLQPLVELIRDGLTYPFRVLRTLASITSQILKAVVSQFASVAISGLNVVKSIIDSIIDVLGRIASV